MNITEIMADNEAVVRGLTSSDPFIRKEAADGMNSVLRLYAQEDGFFRNILPPEFITPAEFTKLPESIKPVVVRDMQPGALSAHTVPIGTTANVSYFSAPRFIIALNRIITDRYRSDVADLLTYDIEIREVFYDMILKAMLYEEDESFITTVNSICGTLNDSDTATNARLAEVGAMGYVTVGTLSRATIADALSALSETDRHLSTASVLINNVTTYKVLGLDHDATGPNLSEEMFQRGFTIKEIMGVPFNVTIKTDLVATNEIYMFGEPKYLGAHLIAEDVTVSSKAEDYWIEVGGYELSGATLKNVGAMARARFTGTSTDWRPAASSSS